MLICFPKHNSATVWKSIFIPSQLCSLFLCISFINKPTLFSYKEPWENGAKQFSSAVESLFVSCSILPTWVFAIIFVTAKENSMEFNHWAFPLKSNKFPWEFLILYWARSQGCLDLWLSEKIETRILYKEDSHLKNILYSTGYLHH